MIQSEVGHTVEDDLDRWSAKASVRHKRNTTSKTRGHAKELRVEVYTPLSLSQLWDPKKPYASSIPEILAAYIYLLNLLSDSYRISNRKVNQRSPRFLSFVGS
ncbi:hypothetical protein MRB53_011638 [Persea americana]|uniref:Uncharacterized protein n=1 Tax=Persea americana TaxID=3435 RepID=A0ACC2LWA7_PERAE|nr:hypothetical protein MRB53_011638 [Persea americana]